MNEYREHIICPYFGKGNGILSHKGTVAERHVVSVCYIYGQPLKAIGTYYTSTLKSSLYFVFLINNFEHIHAGSSW